MLAHTSLRSSMRIIWSIVAFMVVFSLVVPTQAARLNPDEIPPETLDGNSPQPVARFGKVFLPLVTRPASTTAVEETYPLNYEAKTIHALGGRLVLDFPRNALSRNCTLHVETPDVHAGLLAVNLRIPCTGYTDEVGKFGLPVKISIGYSPLDLTYIDEMRLNIWTWLPTSTNLQAADASTDPQAVDAPTDPLNASIVDPVNKVVSGEITSTGGYTLKLNYSLSDLGTGPGGVYAAAAPIIYQVQSGGTLSRFANLDEIDGASELYHTFTRFAVNPVNGEIYLPLMAKTYAIALYALNGSSLRSLYAVPSGEELWNMAYRSSDALLYLSMSKVTGSWFGCTLRDVWIRAIKISDGSLVGDIPLQEEQYIKGMTVDSSGRLLAARAETVCDPSNLGSSIVSNDGSSPLSIFRNYNWGFRGVEYLTSDGSGKSYFSNGTADMISVVAGAKADVVGAISVQKPGPLTISGNTLYVVSNGRITTLAKNSFDAALPAVQITPSDSLSGTNLHISVKAMVFSRVPAHNVLFYNGARHLPDPGGNTGVSQELGYILDVPQPPDLNTLVPFDQQMGKLEFRINGISVAAVDVHAPQLPYEVLYFDADNKSLTLARGTWLMFFNYAASLTSQEGLFPIQYGGQTLYQFNQVGTFNFVAAYKNYHLQVTVTPYGVPTSVQKTIDPAAGGILWGSGGALEIPPGALPDNPGGYVVTYSTTENTYTLQGTVTDKSMVQKFSFTPAVTHLNQAVTLHIPRKDSGALLPVMAFFDPAVKEIYPIPTQVDPKLAAHLTLILPADDYPASLANPAAAAPKPGYLRRGLNWLGSMGIWHAIGLPNDKIETTHFVILFNTSDCSPAYASTMLDALDTAYEHFNAMGFTMPGEQVYVKVAPWFTSSLTPGLTPGIGTLGNFYILMNNALPTVSLQDTAVHEFMHVLQKTNATPDGRYMNPVWWEEATAIWAQYEIYPAHDVYNLAEIHSNGENFLHHNANYWGGLEVEQMNAIMSMAVYLQKKYGSTAVLSSFLNLQADWDVQTGILQSIGQASGQSFDKFYEQFAKDYWMQKFAPVDKWTFVDNITDPAKIEENDIYPFILNQPVNNISINDIQQLSSGVYKIYSAETGLPVSFNDPLAVGSVIKISSSCTGMKFYFYDSTKKPIDSLKFDGASAAPDDQLYYDKRLGSLTAAAPLYLVYMDDSYNYTANCGPIITFEQPTITDVSPTSVTKNTTSVYVVIHGQGFGLETGTVLIGGQTITPTSWSPTSIGFTWNTGSMSGSVTVSVTHKKAAVSNRKSITINP